MNRGSDRIATYLTIHSPSKACVKRPLKIDKTWVLFTNGSLIKVEDIAECSKGSILQIFNLHLVVIGLEKQFLVFLRITVVHRLYRAQWLSGRVLDLRPRGRGFEPHWRHCVVSLGKTH